MGRRRGEVPQGRDQAALIATRRVGRGAQHRDTAVADLCREREQHIHQHSRACRKIVGNMVRVAELTREIEGLRRKLAQAHTIIDVQKKLCTLLGLPTAEEPEEGAAFMERRKMGEIEELGKCRTTE